MAIDFKIKKHMGELSRRNNGWTKELNIVSWMNAAPKFDIREWTQNHDKMSKGVTLTEDEMWRLYKILKQYFNDSTTDDFNNQEEKYIPVEEFFLK